jgi:hypothetical protein
MTNELNKTPVSGQDCYIGSRFVGKFIGINSENGSYVVFKTGEYKGYHAHQLKYSAPEKKAHIKEKQERIDHANELIKLIASHGRNFFLHVDRETKISRYARFEFNSGNRLWFIDDYTQSYVYPYDTQFSYAFNKGFSHGGTLRNLCVMMREYIIKGEKIDIFYIAPNRGELDGNHDMWGYGPEACKALRAACENLPIICNPERS